MRARKETRNEKGRGIAPEISYIVSAWRSRGDQAGDSSPIGILHYCEELTHGAGSGGKPDRATRAGTAALDGAVARRRPTRRHSAATGQRMVSGFGHGA